MTRPEIPEWAIAAFARVPIAADLTGVDVPTIEELVASGRVRSVRLKRGLHVRCDDVLIAAYDDSGNNRTTTPADRVSPCYNAGRSREKRVEPTPCQSDPDNSRELRLRTGPLIPCVASESPVSESDP